MNTKFTLALNFKIRVDLGLKTKGDAWESNTVVDENGVDIRFNSIIDGVNYVAKRGWVLEEVFNAVDRNELGGIQHYLFSKTVTDDSQIKEGFLLKRDFKETE